MFKKICFSFSGVKRICFGHALDENNMRFSCFPKATIFPQKGSINVTPLPGHEESNNFNIGVVSSMQHTSKSLLKRNFIKIKRKFDVTFF